MPDEKDEKKDEKNEKKDETRFLSETESLKVETANLRQQNLDLQRQLIDTQKALVSSQETNYQLRSEMLKGNHSKLFEALGLTGDLSLERQEDGRYKVVKGDKRGNK